MRVSWKRAWGALLVGVESAAHREPRCSGAGLWKLSSALSQLSARSQGLNAAAGMALVGQVDQPAVCLAGADRFNITGHSEHAGK